MEIGEKINNITAYNESMMKSMEDKLWFVKHLDSESEYTFVDFGCADGTLINILSQMFPKCTYIGYDVSEQMIDLAKTKFNWNPSLNIQFFTNWNNVEESLKRSCGASVLILSSVIHEIFSYGTDESINEFFRILSNIKFRYVFIRDMMASRDMIRDSELANHVRSICYADRTLSRQLSQFEKEFSTIDNNLYLVHFLLKYRWTINWNREVKENYFPIYIEDFLNKIKDKYNINYLERFRVPFLDKCIWETFGITLTDNTHIKLFLKRKHNGF